MKPYAVQTDSEASTLDRVIEPLASFICAADQPRAALASAMRLLLQEVEQTDRAARRHLELAFQGA